jgi:hypothetical protein
MGAPKRTGWLWYTNVTVKIEECYEGSKKEKEKEKEGKRRVGDEK